MLTGESIPIEAGAGVETYAGALVRRGEAVAEVTATGTRTKFGRTAELVRTAHVVSSQQKAVLRVVRNLAVFNGVVIVMLVAYAYFLGLPVAEIIPLVLTAVLASIPVALPATFTLASALGARALAKQGVLPTRLSAVDEAATMDVLCADKTGTLTRNELTVTDVRPMPGFERRTSWRWRRSPVPRAGRIRSMAPFARPPAARHAGQSASIDQVRAVRSGDEDVRGDRRGNRAARPSASSRVPLPRSSGSPSRRRARRRRHPNSKAQGFRVLAVAAGATGGDEARRARSRSATRRARIRPRSSPNCTRWACAP